MWGMHDVGWGWWLVSTLAMVGFWAAIVYGVVWLARNGGGSGSAPEEREAPEEILRRRLAAGEISVEEYERVHGALSGEAPAQPPEPALR